jgi:octaheme c-type cytochrome (tetrathionate reductase family)
VNRKTVHWQLATFAAGLALATGTTAQQRAAARPTADHRQFGVLHGPFADGPAVTRACLGCHNDAARQVMQTRHWTWVNSVETLAREDGHRVGKAGDVVNNFCIAVASNEPRCTSCHAGYGWKDREFDLADPTRVDCLVCHDQTGTYRKFPTGAGHPNYEPVEWPKGSGQILEPPDLANIARHVGPTRRENCGACHFSGGGGDGVKHGDMDGSLARPGPGIDVHMAPDGGDFSCTVCHTTVEHRIAGPERTLPARDRHRHQLPGSDGDRLSCESCHTARPHGLAADTAANRKLDDHTDVLACASCHVPTMARARPTKVWWDWSTAGERIELADGTRQAFVRHAEVGGHRVPVYDSQKGSFLWAVDAVPEYFWFDGHVEPTFLGDRVDDARPGRETARRSPGGAYDGLDLERPVVTINRIRGSRDDPRARIWPFKVHRGKQPYDPVGKRLLVPKLFGAPGSGAFWSDFDWQAALAAGMAYAGDDWSGSYEFVQTEMFWPLAHMVAPKEAAVGCVECHRPGPEGRLAAVDGVYLPGRDRNVLLDRIGIALVLGSVLAGLAHGGLRILVAVRG